MDEFNFDWESAEAVSFERVPRKVMLATVIGFERAGRIVTPAQLEWRHRSDGVYCAHLDGLFFAGKE